LSAEKARLVFIIEDDEAVRSSTRLLLETMHYEVGAFPSAEAFLQDLSGREAGCLLLDYHLGGMNGVDLLELLRGRGITTPAVILTANRNLSRERLSRVGVLAVLPKPPVTGDLLALIEKACATPR
jgi:two-component system, LuxR family, response regulator FixJ